MAIISGYEIQRKLDELAPILAVVVLASAVEKAVCEGDFEELGELGGAVLDWLLA